ncbi:hypothetical protein Tco_1501157 [Tanacetum coccineum]
MMETSIWCNLKKVLLLQIITQKSNQASKIHLMDLSRSTRSWNTRIYAEIKKVLDLLKILIDPVRVSVKSYVENVKELHGKCFAMKDLGEAAFILGIKIYRDRSKRLIGLGQMLTSDQIYNEDTKMDNFQTWTYPHARKTYLNKSQVAQTPNRVGTYLTLKRRGKQTKAGSFAKLPIAWHGFLPTLDSTLPGGNVSFVYRNIEGLNISIIGSVATSSMLDMRNKILRFAMVQTRSFAWHYLQNSIIV